MTSSSSSSSSSSVRLQCRGWSGPLLEGLNELRHERALCDLTIVSATGHVHMAHACVLAAASSYVRAHVLHAPARYPPVMLPISDDTWYTVLRFVYTGETRLQSGRLESLRRAAMTLGIHRLTTAANTLIRQLRAAKLAGVTEVKIAAEASLKQTEVNNVEEVTYNNADSADTTAASTQSEMTTNESRESAASIRAGGCEMSESTRLSEAGEGELVDSTISPVEEEGKSAESASLVKVEDEKSSESPSIAMEEEGEFAEPASLVKEEEEDGFSESMSSAKEDYATISTWTAEAEPSEASDSAFAENREKFDATASAEVAGGACETEAGDEGNSAESAPSQETSESSSTPTQCKMTNSGGKTASSATMSATGNSQQHSPHDDSCHRGLEDSLPPAEHREASSGHKRPHGVVQKHDKAAKHLKVSSTTADSGFAKVTRPDWLYDY